MHTLYLSCFFTHLNLIDNEYILDFCSWFPEIASYARKHKTMDFGLLMTLTSEWMNYKGQKYHWVEFYDVRRNLQLWFSP